MKKIIAIGLALTASMSIAQPPSSRPPAPSRPGPAGEAGDKAQTAADIALLLDLKPAQRTALDAYLAAMPAFGPPPPRPPRPVEGGPADHPPARPEALSFIARLDAMESRIEADDARRKAGITAARSFYGQLDERQKQRFDALERVRRAPPPPPGGRVMPPMPHPGDPGAPASPDMPKPGTGQPE